MTLAATLILSTFTMAPDAFAVFDEPGTYAIKTNEGIATCTTNEGDSCGLGSIEARFRQLVTDVEGDSSSGVAQGQIRISVTSVGNPGDAIIFENKGPLSFQYDAANRLVEMMGEVESESETWGFSYLGMVSEFKNEKAKIEFIELSITNPAGVLFTVEDLKGTVTEVEGLNVEEGDVFEIRESGSVVINDHDLNIIIQGEVKSKFELLITDVDPLGNIEGVVNGTICILPGIEQGCFRTIENVASMALGYNAAEGRIYLIGDMKDKETGTAYEYDALGRITQVKDNKAKIESIGILSGDNGDTLNLLLKGDMGKN